MSTIRSRPYPGLPAPEEPMMLRGGGVNPVWYQWFATVQMITSNPMIMSLLSLDVTTLSDNDTIRWNAVDRKWEFQ